MRDRSQGGDEGYLASVSDLMVGLLFLFIILLMAFGLNFREAQSKADLKINELAEERDLIELERDALMRAQEMLVARQQELLREREETEEERDQLEEITETFSNRNAARRAMLENIQSLLGRRNIEVNIVPENGVVRLPEDMLFDTGSDTLRKEAEPALRALAEVLARVLPCHALTLDQIGPDCNSRGAGLIETVLIEGHTDTRPIAGGRFEDNWDLGARRGTSVFTRLVELQPTLNTITNKKGEALLGVSSYEARRPVLDNDTDEAYRLNRRIDIRFLISAPTDQELRSIADQMILPETLPDDER
jgi:flagellar motor protein MotB